MERQPEALTASSNVPTRRRRRAAAGAANGDTSQLGSQKDASPQLKRSASTLHTYDSLPDYLQDNEFIITGYRANLPVKATLKSFWEWHNETGNIWTHFLGFCFFVYITVWLFRSPPAPLAFAAPQLEVLWGQIQHRVGENLHLLQGSLHSLQDSFSESVHHLQDSLAERVHHLTESVHSLQESVAHLQGSMQHQAVALAAGISSSPLVASLVSESSAARNAVAVRQQQVLQIVREVLHWPTARWPVYVFCAGAMVCLLLSSICHLLGCCQKHIAQTIWRFDYAGIAVLIVASFYPPVYYGFMCHPVWAAGYLAVITALGACCVAVSLLDVFQTPKWRATRAGMFVGLGLIGVIPVVHQLALFSHVWHIRAAAQLIALMGATYIAGALFFVARVPERWYPGKFDMILHSHQIFHLAVILGAYIHWRAVLLLLEWRDASGGCAVPVTQGPLGSVLQELRELGHDLLHIDQVLDSVWKFTAERLHPGMLGIADTPAAAAYQVVG